MLKPDLHSNTQKLAISGILCALSLVFMLTGIIPGLFFISIFISICTLQYILDNCGRNYWIAAYLATSALALILTIDLELSLTFVCMGWYPIIKLQIDKHNKLFRTISKTIIYVISSYIIYNISIFVFGADEIIENIPGFTVVYVLMFSSIFFMLDIAINLYHKNVLSRLYKLKIQQKKQNKG